MDYQNTLKYLYESVPMFQQVGKEAYKPGLETTQKLDEYFGHPHQQFKTIHIAGTNGKGSCSHTIAAVLQSAGYRVGLFTSPHLVDFRERIRVNAEMVPEEYVVDFVEKHRPFFEPLQPSFFELTTAMAFRYFADRKVDVAVIEVGMGGRLDCTNIIRPDLCVITNIGLDHTQYLGGTLEKIAEEKAGIIKEGVPVVIGRARGAVKKVFSAKAEEMNAPITYTKQTAAGNDVAIYSYPELQKERNSFYEMTRQGLEMFKMLQDKHRKNEKSLEKLLSTFNLDNALRAMDRILDKRKSAIKLSNNHFQDGIFLELTGLYQVENGFTILTALDELVKMGYHISPKNYFEGFSNVCELTGLMGRWQKVYSYPDIICDTGHNVDGIKYICKQLEAIRANDGKKIHIVFGMVNDKDISGVLKILPKDATYYFTKASVKRALPENELQELARKAGLKGNAYPTVVEAVQAAKKDCPPKDFIFVGGSSFIVADLLANRDTLDLY
ncbi:MULTISPECIES: bifunctional folylpolyglutamate synthase/dihydrofolate synthase [Bacteroides]|jgi:dihydrofolate synthase/folylpolyglutamate synthase|uniref:bifunctional folylpolyglutamate synthase/dihydrofolate synthase n=1 Tax=Bacteroides TaxID=816 RepID=UPI00117E97A5|nr:MULTISPECIES: folylpolyglutamate synthase/dihydrofolate synthase family protein [Bacteroides]